MYAEADDGERVQCQHPSERRMAERVIGEIFARGDQI
jgi:hypothetical protein